MERIKFYSIDDLLVADNLLRIKENIDKYDENKQDYNINDIIEFYNIIKYIDSGCYKKYLSNWSNEDICKMENTVKKYKAIVAIYFKSICDENIIVRYQEIQDNYHNYREDYFELIENYKIYEYISEQTFYALLHTPKVFLQYILYNKNMTYHHGKTIRRRFYEDVEYAEIILDYYEAKHTGNNRILYFPKELTIADKEKIIKKYIDSENPNLNYLRLINNIKNRDELTISDKIRLASIKRTKIENDKLFSNSSGIEYGAEVRFAKSQDDVIEFTREKHIFKYSYDIRWIYENTDFNTLLNNFIYLFGYVDRQMRITLISKESELGLTEKFFGVKSKNEYEIGMTFNIKNMLSMLQIIAYYKELNKINIRLEDVIEWFFKSYLLEEFDIENFIVRMPSKDSTYYEKCKSILPEMDYILKQYNLLVEDGIIDQELLEVSSTSVLFERVRSLIDNKYIYGNDKSEEFNNLCYYFFSDQCLLHYTDKFKSKGYDSFYKLLISENVRSEDYVGYTKILLNNVIEKGYVFIDANGYIRIKDEKMVIILNDLYNNEVISYWKYPLKYREKMDELIEKNLFVMGSSLFSKQEQEYFNFYLNQRSFNNTFDLRNKYLHGNKLRNDDENTHYNNYMLFLKLIILIIIKINDELCLKEQIKNNKLKIIQEE